MKAARVCLVEARMSDDLVNDLQRLSVSTNFPFLAINKKPFKIISAVEEFSAFSPFKESFRLLLNYKDMTTLQLKAGTLLRIKLDNFVVPNVFECWPSVSIPQSSIGTGAENPFEWLKTVSSDKCNIVRLTASSSPFTIAKSLQIELKDPSAVLNTDQRHLILKWLDCNRFLSAAAPSWQFLLLEDDGKKLDFCIKCLDEGDFEADVVKYCPETTKIVQSKNAQFKAKGFEFGGLSVQVNELDAVIKRVLMSSANSSKSTSLMKESHGVLLYGPSGTGKTLMIRHLTAKHNLPVFALSASDFSSAAFGEAELKLQEVFESAQKMAPSVIFMDEIDSLCPKRDSHSSAASIRLTTLLLTLMDGCLSSSTASPILFIGATNAVNSLDPAVRRSGRFDREIEIPPPNRDDRLSILSALMKSYPNSLITQEELGWIADSCHGFVGADLCLLCKEAFLSALIKARDNSASTGVDVSFDDFISSLSKVKPSAIREVFIEVPKTKWTDIGGQHETKQKLIECVEWPIKYPDRFERLGIRPPKGVLLFGPPGCSKTLLAKALASESGLNFLAVKGPEIFSKYVGESEKKIRDIFRKARQASPAIIFFDEFDSIAGRSAGVESSNSVTDRVMSQLLNEMDGIESLINVIVIAATNKPDLIDKALLRPGRFDRHIYIAPPDFEGRAEIFRIISRRMPFDKSINPETFAQLTEGFTGAELTSVCQNAALSAIERDIGARTISFEDLEHCILLFEKQLNPESLKLFEKFIE